MTSQPRPAPPSTAEAGAFAPSMTTSVKSALPVSLRNGLTSMPGWCMSTSSSDSPACLGTVGSVRTSMKHLSAYWAQLVQILRPVIS